MSWSLWLLLYICGYAAGVTYALAVARRAYADRKSLLWNYEGTQVDGLGAVGCGLLVVFVPLMWPIVGLGMIGWGLVVKGAPSPVERGDLR